MNEFDIIDHFFTKQLTTRNDVVLGIGDDCAIVEIPKDHQLAITTDTLIANIHFSEDLSAADIGYKSLAVNLSDLAAMGATPAWVTLALTLPQANKKWLSEFCNGFFELANRYQVQLIGGDLTHGPLTITIAAHGFIPKNQALKRSTAKPGDLIYITNTIGDAALGLQIEQKKISLSAECQKYCLGRLHRPEPRIEIGEHLRDIASAAIDISDGLAADLGHILQMSHVGAELDLDTLPLSDALQHSISKDHALHLALTGGDDYELCFTVPPSKQHLLKEQFTNIGTITEKPGLNLRFKDGTPYNGAVAGYKHF